MIGRREKKRVGRPWCCAVNFQAVWLGGGGGGGDGGTTVFCEAGIVSPAQRDLKAALTTSLQPLTSLSLSVAGRARVKLLFVPGGIQFRRDPVSGVSFLSRKPLR